MGERDDRDWRIAKELGYLESEIRNRAKREDFERHQRETERRIKTLEAGEAEKRQTEIEASYLLGQQESEKTARRLIEENDARKRSTTIKILRWVFGSFVTGIVILALNLGRLWDIFR